MMSRNSWLNGVSSMVRVSILLMLLATNCQSGHVSERHFLSDFENQCGPIACLFALKFSGKDISYSKIAAELKQDEDGLYSLYDIKEYLLKFEIQAMSAKCSSKELKNSTSFVASFRNLDSKNPAGKFHFIFGYYSSKRDAFVMVDPTLSSRLIFLSEDAFNEMYAGFAVIVK